MLLQVDGSHRAWLEQRGPRFALLLAVDDATGAVVHALFRPAEDARGYFLLMEMIRALTSAADIAAAQCELRAEFYKARGRTLTEGKTGLGGLMIMLLP